MGESNENLLKAIRHYQDSLDKHTENRNENKLSHYLDRLYKLPIKVVHLEQTGVGRTVNGLRKLGGEVGELARRLVTKWKEMVVGEQEEEEDEDEDDEDGYQTGDEQSSDGEESKTYEKEKGRENSSSHRKSDKSHNGTDDRDKVRKSRDNSSKSSHSSESKSSSEKDRHKENGHDRHRSHKRKVESDSEDESPKKKKRSEDESRHRRRVESDSEEEKKRRDKKHKRSDKSEKKKSRESSVDAESDQDTKSKDRRHKSDKKKTPDSSEDESEDEIKNRERRKSEKYKSLYKPSTSKDSHKDKHKHSKREDSKRHEHGSKTKENDKKSKHKSEDKESKHKSEDKESKPKGEDKERVKDRSDDKKEKKKKSTNGTVTIAGIDSGSGTSFAEALGMCEPSSSKSTSKKKTSEKKDKPATKSDDPVPKLLLKEPEPTIEPLDLNLSSLLPPITPNYRPLGNLISTEAQTKKFMTESETLASIITSKNQRTKVYSGNKVGGGIVPSLFELCTRILQDNIDALEYTGGVPYLILKPILEKATPNQLYVMEHHNPYLIDDTDELWQGHCQKEFRNKHRLELETWREMYLRCLDERDAKLKALTANIKQSQDKSLPVRMTKLAYVDAVAKPPRNIARKQAKNGTAFDVRKPSVTPSSRLTSLAIAGEAGKVAVPNPGSRAVERTSGHSAKPKKAPLMLKSISSFKNRFKR